MFKKMKFKKEYIHCVPDKSLIGKRVLYGDTQTDIKSQAESDNWTSCRRTLNSISYDSEYPFVIKDDFEILRQYKFVYYDSEWETDESTEKVYYCVLIKEENRSYFSYTSKKSDAHSYAEFTSIGDALDWCYAHKKFAPIAKAWEDGKVIQYYSEASGGWEDCEGNNPIWDINIQYRVKPTKIYYCYLSKAEPEFIFDKKKPDTHIYAEFTDYHEATDWCKKYDRHALEAKAWEEGKTIQRRNAYGNWEDCEPEWDLYVDYRVKPEDKLEPIEIEKDTYVANGAEISKKRRMTNKELAYWLAQSKGQKATINGNAVCCHSYDLDDDDKEVGDCMIRGWNETDWHEPEVEVTI